MPSRTLDIQVGTPETGLWCARCNLSSVVRFPLYVLRPTGVQAMGALYRCSNYPH